MHSTHLKYTSQWIILYSWTSVAITTDNFRIFSPLQKKPYILLLSSSPHFTIPLFPSSPNLLYVSTDLPVPAMPYKWNKLTVCGLLWLSSFTWYDITGQWYSIALILVLYSFSWLSNSPLCEYFMFYQLFLSQWIFDWFLPFGCYE